MAHLKLNVQKREITGKKVKNLRKEGIVPANIFGKKTKSQSIQVVFSDFNPIYKKAGETSIVDLVIDKAKTPHHSLIRHLQFDPVTDKILHVDFMEVDLKEKIEAEVPIKIEGESQAVLDKEALLLQELNTLLVEATADNIPEEIIVQAEDLKNIGDIIYTNDLKIPGGVEIKSDEKQVVVRLANLIAKEKEEEKPTEETEEAEGAEDAEGTDGETKDKKTEGEEKKTPEKSEGEDKKDKKTKAPKE